ncbi:ABC transporter-like protein [Pseudoxanthomonas spadix BD-a59]|uniref:ABC transporter-like protein n=1 Tax=Pseudoxanthomonas spadix (strain BD-a59) TaxID=1045855 RepID=G7UVM2_PSEUP|nr:ABC transporter ATP-binding protein [Pseudoxanthomonas spadix]AER55139.1 ABC transporter-like protein [Pseudoxanthomonas spadix BD-a59]
MCSDVSIDVERVEKVFPVYSKPHHRFFQMLSPASRKQRWFHEFHALKGVSFQVLRGETVGIIGRNGSGKSTLLQIICGTLSASSGSVRTHGRIAALLELGAGFNPDFTGRENVYMNGTLLGLSREEVDARFERIVQFADIGEFIEQPVKSYSSGMFVRLAFAVAIHVEPDILIVDEALSVGDEAFQRKCYARIEKIREEGATIIFVSHAASTILELCNRAILLDRGDMLAIGEPKAVVACYQKLLYAPADRAQALRDGYLAVLHSKEANDGADPAREAEVGPDAGLDAFEPRPVDAAKDEAYFDPGLISQSAIRYESHGAVIDDPHIETLAGQRVNVLVPGNEYIYTYRVDFERAATGVRFGMLIKALTGVELGGAVSSNAHDSLPLVESDRQATVRFRFRAMVAPGMYFMNAGVIGRVGEEELFLDRLVDVIAFRIPPDPGRIATGFVDFSVGVQIEMDLEQARVAR